MTTKNETSNADTAEQACRTALQEAHQLRSGLLGQLGDRDTKDIGAVQDQLDAVEVEIALEGRRLGHFVEARKIRDAARTDAGKRVQHDANVAQLAAAVTSAAKLGEQSQTLIGLIEAVGTHLAQMDATRTEVAKALRGAALEARQGAPSERVFTGLVERVLATVNDLTLPTHTLRALWNAGLGRIGVTLPPEFIDMRPPGTPDNNRAPPSAVDAANTQLAKLAKLATQIEEWSTTCNLPKKEVA